MQSRTQEQFMLARIEAAEALGVELAPWAQAVRDRLDELVEAGTEDPNMVAVATGLVDQLGVEVRVMDNFGEFMNGPRNDSPYTVAGWWHSGQLSPLYSFGSTGNVGPLLVAEITDNLKNCAADERAELRFLLEYLVTWEWYEDGDR